MESSFGIPIPLSPYRLKAFEAVLLFYEYPTTFLYEDCDGNPIIKEWVDCSDDGLVNRYYYYKTNRMFLKRFFSKDIPYIELIKQNIDGYIVFEDLSEGNKSDYFISTFELMPNDYLPRAEFFFNPEEAVDLKEINEYFRIDTILDQNYSLSEARSISSIKSSETLLFHFNKGKGIGFGTANTEVLAKMLLKFDKFYKENALDYKLGTRRGDIQINAKKNEDLYNLSSTEVYHSIAASYAVLLRPISNQIDIYQSTEAEKISTKIFSLIRNSITPESLKDEYLLHSDFALKAYKDFINEIHSSELNVDFNWFSPFNKIEFTDSIDFYKANQIKINLENLSIDDSSEFRVKGKFRSLNCDTGAFIFMSIGEEKYHGRLDQKVKSISEQITFTAVYEITVLRITTKLAGGEHSKIKDTILQVIAAY